MNVFIKKYNINFLQILFILSLICTGVFHEFYSCAFSVLLIGYLLWKTKREQSIRFYWNNTTISIMVLVGMYALSTLWAIDSGVAWLGFLKNLPALLFLLVILQEKERAAKLATTLPYIVSILAIISIGAMYIPAMESKFSVAGRLAGFFQYPNTFALLLLVAELVLFQKIKYRIYDYATYVILLVSILLTGSRTVFILTVLANGCMILAAKNKKVRIWGLIAVASVLLGISIYVIAFGGGNTLGRLLKISLSESTFVGRILYYIDAFPVILKSPFGLGYLGYYYVQQSVQTGLYSVRFIHNDFLQIMLDVGWIPCIMLFVAIIKTIFNRKTELYRKVILSVIVLHSCFDFNLQFISMIWVLLLFMNFEDGKEIVWKKQRKWIGVSAITAGIISIYCGVALVLCQVEKYELSLRLYPWNTQAATMYLAELEDIEEAGTVADKILNRNEYVTLAYSAKARQAYSNGDFGKMIQYKNELLKKAPYQYAEYEDYCYMLINGIQMYTNAGDLESANVCKQELLAVPDKLEEAKHKLSRLGKKIKDQPITELPQDISSYIDRLEGM